MKIGGKLAQNLVEEFQSPVFVYLEDTIQKRCSELIEALKVFPTKTKALYACKANTNPNILKSIQNAGIQGIDTVSVGECMIAEKCGYKKEDILYTENFISDEELDFAITNKILINVGELKTLEKIGQKYPNTEIAIRINPHIGSGEHSHVITGGPESKFGIYVNQLDEILELVEKYNLRIIGIHQHIGSNICQADISKYVDSATCILETALHFQKNLRFINIGGGIGVPYKQSDESLNLQEAFQKVSEKYVEIYQKKGGKDVELWVEPGRFLVAECGYLLCKATAIKTNEFYTFIGTDTGLNHLIRPAFYGSHHEVNNATNFEAEKNNKVTVCGNICESSDIFAKDRLLQETKEGDILAIQNAGAYCYSMSNNYNSRMRPPEILINGAEQSTKLIRRRENLEDLLSTVIY